MPAQNVVDYIINIQTKAAEKGLDDLADDLKKVVKELKKTTEEGKKTGDGLETSLGDAAEAFNNVLETASFLKDTILSVGKSIFGVVKKITDLTNELNDLSVRSGLAANTIQGLRQALVASGQPAEGLNEILGAISNQFAQLSMEGSSVEKKFSAFGIAVKDTSGKLRSNNEILLDGIKKLQGISDSSERSRVAVTLFGEAGAKLNQALAAGNFENFIMFTERFGIKTGPEASKAAAQLQLSMSLLNTVFDGTLQKIVSATDGQNRLIKGMVKLGSTAAFVGSLVDTFSNEINDLTGVLQDLVVFGIKNFLFALGPFGIAMRIQIALVETLAGQFFDVNKAIADLTGSVYNSIDPTNRLGSALEKANSESAEFEKRMNKMLSSLDGLPSSAQDASLGISQIGNSAGDTADQIRTLNDVIRDLARSLGIRMFDTDQIIGDINLVFNALDKKINQVFDPSKIQNWVDKLKSQLGSTIQEFTKEQKLQKGFGAEIEILDEKRWKAILRRMKIGVGEVGVNLSKSLLKATAIFGKALGSAATKFIPVIGKILGVLSIARKLGERGETPKEIQKSVEEDIRARAKAIEIGLQVLPRILFETLPPLFVEFADRIIFGFFKAIAELTNKVVGFFKSIFTREGRRERREQRGSRIMEGAAEFNRRLDVLLGIASKRSGGRYIPSARGGIKFTGADEGLAMLHRGEFVVPETGQMPQAVQRTMGMGQSGINITINAAVVESNAVDELVRQIERRFQTFGSSTSPLFGGR